MREACLVDDAALSTDQEPQETLCEVMYLQSRLAHSQEQNRLLTLQLTGGNDSRSFRVFRLLQSWRASLMPAGSRRERLGMVGFDTICRITHKIMGIGQALVPGPHTARESEGVMNPAVDHEDIVVLPSWRPSLDSLAMLEKRRLADRTQAPRLPFSGNEALNPEGRLDPNKIPYSPMSWQLMETPVSDSGSINLAIISLLHRSGSTLLQRICNARGKTLVWGEHSAILRQFADIYKGVAGFSVSRSEEREEYFRRGEDPNMWIANMCPDLEYVEEAVVNSAKALLDTLYGEYREWHDIVGFKEVHYGRAEVELLRKCYPEAKIMILVRHPYTTWNSTPRDWYPSLHKWATLWQTRAREFATLASTDSNCYVVRYEDIVRQEARTIKIIMDVAQVTREEISDVLGHKIGSHHVGISKSERQTILDYCRDAMELLGYGAR